jgi:hypothetical protein
VNISGTVFESLARHDLFITDAERANVIGSRLKDRDAAFIGTQSHIQILSLRVFLRVLPYFYPVMQACAFSDCSYYWLGDIVSKEDGLRVTVQVSRFSCVREVEVLIISSFSRHLD